MAKSKDPLAQMSSKQRAKNVRGLVMNVFGEHNGLRIWRQMEPGFVDDRRQLGDARDPAENYWRGAWRIYEME